MTEPDDVKVCLDLMDERWPGYSTAKYVIRKEIERLRDIEFRMKGLEK